MTGEFEYPTSSQPVLGCLDSYGKKSWILVDFLVDPIIHTYIIYVMYVCIVHTYMYPVCISSIKHFHILLHIILGTYITFGIPYMLNDF